MKKFFQTICLSLLVAHIWAQDAKIAIEQPVYLNKDTVSGTLVSQFPLDSRKIKKQPLVIFIAGSGPTDRDGNSAFLDGKNDAYKQLADSLYTYDIASYRYDKIGIGQSSKNIQEQELKFSSNVNVVESIFKKMRDLGFKEIYLLGHSEGSLVGMIAAQQLDVAGYISVAGAGRSFYTILQDQLSQQLPEEMLQSTMAKLDSIKNGYTVTTYSPMLGSLLRESVQPYLREMMSYQPSSEISKVEVPVLILQGGSDLQITEEDANTLYNARPESTYHLYPEMNHVLKRVQSEEENKASYTDPDFPLDFNISADIASWIERQ